MTAVFYNIAMKKETSYGAVIYKIENNKLLFLIEHMALGHYSICKGHIEKGESETQCALREIKEETNLDVILDTSFSYTVSYSPKKNIIKDVTFFLATPATDTIIVQKEEVVSASYLEYDDALSKLTFDTDRRTLELANEYILKKYILNKDYDVVTIGELLIDFTSINLNGETLFKRNAGGAPANVAVCASSLGSNCAFIGKVGNDMFGSFLMKSLTDKKVDTSNVIFDDDYFTTLAFVDIDSNGERSFSFARKPGADAMIRLNEINMDMLRNTKVFHFGSLSLTSNVSKETVLDSLSIAKNSGAIISFDPNYRSTLWKSKQVAKKTISSVLSKIDILKISDEEISLVSDTSNYLDAVKKLSTYKNIKLILITLGKHGTYVYFKNVGKLINAYKVSRVVDTNGAGDSFMGSFLYMLTKANKKLDDYTIKEIYQFVDFANATASIVVENSGAISSMPTLDEVLKRISIK